MKIKKIFGYFLYNFIAKKMPASYKKINFGSQKVRGLCGKLLLEKCGENINIEQGADFSSRIEIGDNSGIGMRANLKGKIIIGENVMMGPDCIIYTRNHNFKNINIPMIKQGYQEEKSVVIGDDVWIGGRVVILPGVKIGNGVVLGANSVVTKDVPNYAVLGGNPAKILKFRNNT